MKTGILSFLPLLVAFTTCTQPTDSTPSGAFSYTSYDSTGAPLSSGWFTMKHSDSVTVTGEWHFNAADNPQNVGPQLGEGTLTGMVQGDKVVINLNPEFADNNVGLSGTMTGDRISGIWMWTTFAGPANQGTFTAVKK